MSRTPDWLAAAQAKGLAGPQIAPEADEPAPWLVALLMVGALLCCASALGMLALLLQNLLEPPTGYVLALLLWGAAVFVLHKPLPLFVHCMAVVGVGTASIWLGALAFSQMPQGASWPWLMAGALQAALLLVSAGVTHPRWVKQLMGVAAAIWLVMGLWFAVQNGLDVWLPMTGSFVLLTVMYLAGPVVLLALALPWALCLAREARWASHRDGASWAAFADGLGVGLLIAILALSQIGALTMLLLSTDEQQARVWAPYAVLAVVSAALVLAFGLALMRRWREAGLPRLPAGEGWPVLLWIAVLLATLASAAMPWMAPVALLAAACAMAGRWRMLAACGVAALGVLGRFYYDLSWPLATKGLALAGLGVVLAVALAIARGHRRAVPAVGDGVAPMPRARAAAGVTALAALLAFGLVNLDVWRKEQVVRHGEAVLVPLMPVDPRSLMQGDYMDLRFDIPESVAAQLGDSAEYTVRTQAPVVMALNEQHQASMLRLAVPGETLAANERVMPLKRLKGRWTLVTDAYFFPEGGGKAFEAARFGEFRVLPDGRALLVGLSDAQGRPIRAPADLRD